jgi:O-succinylbenzoate synthase
MPELRIERVVLHHVRMRLQAPFRTSFGEEHDRECLILQVDEAGVSGWGECVAGSFPGYSYETVSTARHILEAYFVPLLLQARIDHPTDVPNLLSRYKGHPMARAGLELAIWDLFGKITNQSLQQLIGGSREQVQVGVSIGIQSDLKVLEERISNFLLEGYRRIKLKIRPGMDLDTVRHIRDKYPTLDLQVDANAAYRLDDAEVFEQMDAFDLQLIEQPFAEDDLLDHQKLQQRIQTPICLDESIRNARSAKQALEIDACRVVNIKLGRVGGLTEAIQIHDICIDQKVPVWCGGMLETGIGRAANLALASLAGFVLPGDISATDRYYAKDIATPRFNLEAEGTIRVPDGTGLGVEIDTKALEEFRVAKVEISR